ncbi:MAG: signal peptide peptidase SppA [Coleofasciculaceae cyanobacterium RL_1_1]|nr:signal peptide peptidase SppA [Coleofasciculaceae cyanobacterium RL_1_1]
MIWPFRPNFCKQIARVEISGAIAASTRKQVLTALKTVEERKFPAVLLRIDSPGGTVVDSQEIHAAIERLRETQGTKVIASFGNISASGGVYVGVSADHIVANSGTITGSIGVILRGNNLEKLLDRVGVSFKTIKSGPYKDILSFDRELTDPERDILQALIDSSYHQFVEAVSKGRKLEPDQVREFADGRVFTGQQALELGLVDRLGTEEDARRWACELVGLDPEKTRTFAIEAQKSALDRALNRSQTIARLNAASAWVDFELTTNGQPLWMYHP